MEITSPLKAIRAKCLDCCCEQLNEVKYCPASNCPLHPFRFGRNPFRAKRELTDDQKEVLRQSIEIGLEKNSQ